MRLPLYRDAAASLDARAADLLGRMSVAEKAGQLNQIHLHDDPARALALAREGRVGSRVLAWNAFAGADERRGPAKRALNELQRAAVEESRLGIPLLFGRDVIHGHRTVFPMPLAMANSFDPALVCAACEDIAREARADGVHWTFAPMVDLGRDPRWGRVVEGFGEDPHLAAELAAAAVCGFQGDSIEDWRRPDKLLACLKHFVGYGAAEGGRDYDTTEISPHTLWNVYLPPFIAGLRAGAGTVMAGFHDLDGEPVSGSAALLTGLLKDRLGFGGFVISDWNSVAELVPHGVAADRREAARRGLLAGVDMDMASGVFHEHLEALVASGEVPEARLDDAVRRILRAKFALGLFERPYIPEEPPPGVLLAPAHLANARRAALASMVLLKNERAVLPLGRAPRRLAVVGPFIDQRRDHLGIWTLDGRADETRSIAEAFRAAASAAPGLELLFAASASHVQPVMAKADAIVLVVGEDHSRSGENANVADLRLPADQDALVRLAAARRVPLVVVVCAARPLVLTDAAARADALLWMSHLGSAAAEALVAALLGDEEPGGRLACSLPWSTGQCPIYYNRKPTGRPTPDTGYRDAPRDPLYRFGHGLGYTSFELSALRLDAARLVSPDGATTARVTLRNTGERAGSTVVQLYVRDLVASRTRPLRELRGFRRVSLAPGERIEIEFPVGFAQLGYFAAPGEWTVEPGRFVIEAGLDSAPALAAPLEVAAG
jgi:beta-glucosidase